MKLSLHGMCSILAHEAVILTACEDSVGMLTIGVGHTAGAGAPVPKQGMKISLTEAFNIFRQDLGRFERDVQNTVTVPLTQNQYDALVSWHFNTGALKTATLTQKLNAGDYDGAEFEFARWKKAGGKVLQGLGNRRKGETLIFASADYVDPEIVLRETRGSKAKRLSRSDVIQLIQGGSGNEEDLTTAELLANPKSKVLPKLRPQQSATTSRAAVEKFEDLIPELRQSDAVKILGVRGYYTNTMGKAGQNDRGLYDDAIFVVEPNGVHNFNANTDPSKHRSGIATLKSGQAVRYVPGPHGFKRKNGPYPAFRQDSPCTVSRDNGADETGVFWLLDVSSGLGDV